MSNTTKTKVRYNRKAICLSMPAVCIWVLSLSPVFTGRDTARKNGHWSTLNLKMCSLDITNIGQLIVNFRCEVLICVCCSDMPF